MTAKIRSTVKKLNANVRRNSRRVRAKLRKASGAAPNAALVYSVAKYYKTLDKLAKE
jgi:hypothetical protein